MGVTMETVTDCIFLGSKFTADGDCSHEIKRHLLLGRKAVTDLESVLKSRYITLTTEVHIVRVMIFPVVMCGCESWNIKKAEHQRIAALANFSGLQRNVTNFCIFLHLMCFSSLQSLLLKWCHCFGPVSFPSS